MCKIAASWQTNLLYSIHMKIVSYSPEALREAIEIINAGGTVAHATETCYGFACDLTNPAAVTKLFAIKQRPRTQPVSALFPSVSDAKKWVEWNNAADELAKKHLPGPLTIILPLKENIPLYPTPDGGSSLGVRVSSNPQALALAEEAGCVLSTTSANIHGQPNPYSAADIETQFADADAKPDLILDSGELPHTPPSTVVNLMTENVQALRKGEVNVGM